ncbi:MAG: hypothetical protein Kow0060_19890 [Methylohalobius crimeensis]
MNKSVYLLYLRIAVLLVFAYGSYLAAIRAGMDPATFVFGALTGLVIGFVWYYLDRLRWRQRETAYHDYADYVANTVSLVYLKHGPCPACGRSVEDDELADGFSAHSPSCPILAEITGFGERSGPY